MLLSRDVRLTLPGAPGQIEPPPAARVGCA